MVLTTREALRALADGKKIRPTYWPKKFYIYLNDDGIIVDNDGDRDEFLSDRNYVLWEELEKKEYVLFKGESA